MLHIEGLYEFKLERIPSTARLTAAYMPALYDCTIGRQHTDVRLLSSDRRAYTVYQSSTIRDTSCCEQREADHVTMLAHPSNARSDVRHTDVPPMRFGMMGARSYLHSTCIRQPIKTTILCIHQDRLQG